MKKILLPLLVLCATGLHVSVAFAERADRKQPVQLEAERVSVDDVKRTHVFEGKVVLTQGSLVIRSERLVVTQDAEGFQKGVATGGENGLARFRQKREGKNEYVDGEAERIVYDARTEQAEFFVRARVRSGSDEVQGNYIWYDGLTEQYVVTAVPGAPPGAADGRVRATIRPKSAQQADSPGTAAPAPQ